jgi:hypothetical protein
LLTAIARARSWMNDLSEGRVNSFEEITRSENKIERHIQHLAPLAFVSPRIVEAIANGRTRFRTLKASPSRRFKSAPQCSGSPTWHSFCIKPSTFERLAELRIWRE